MVARNLIGSSLRNMVVSNTKDIIHTGIVIISELDD